MQKLDKQLTQQELEERNAARGLKQAALLDRVMGICSLKNDAALSRTMEVAPPVISKLRSGSLPIGSSYIIALHELSALSVKEIKACLGVPMLEKNRL